MPKSDLLPVITVAVISCNRFHYLKATLESARRCIQYPHVEWIVVDNASVEEGLREYLDSSGWIDQCITRERRDPQREHNTALNTIVQEANGDYLLILSDDLQFVVEGPWMSDCIEVLEREEWIGSISLMALRTAVTRSHFTWRRWMRVSDVALEIKRYGTAFRPQRTLKAAGGSRFRTFGWRQHGINGVGMLSVTPTWIWRELGQWKAVDASQVGKVEGSGGSEDDMLERYVRSGLNLQMAMPIVPVATAIMNDPKGTQAKVRGDRRLGLYASPEGDFYYRIWRQEEMARHQERSVPLSFEEMIEPIGFDLPTDEKGNLLKVSINTEINQPIS